MTVALFVVDQRMPLMTGTQFLAKPSSYIGARRVLLTAYAIRIRPLRQSTPSALTTTC